MAQIAPFAQHVQARIAANDAMVALLVGAESADAALRGLDDDEKLVDALPKLPSRERLNRTVADARDVLRTAERHLAFMAIPYVVSIYHRTVGDALELLRRDGRSITERREVDGETKLVDVSPHSIELATVHEVLARAIDVDLGAIFDLSEMNAFEFVRFLRNRLTHHRGIAGPKLAAEWKRARGSRSKTSPPADGQQVWLEVAKGPIKIVRSRDPLALGADELFAVLAITKRLADDVETAVIGALSRRVLAEVVVEDYLERFPDRVHNGATLERKLVGFRKGEHPRLALDKQDLVDAAKRVIAQGAARP